MTNEMQQILTYIGIAMVVILPLGFYGFTLIDKLIKRMYEAFNDEWQKAGKPCGMFYAPAEAKSIESMFSMQLNLFSWLFKTPTWIKNDTISLKLLKRLRWSFLIVNITMLPLFVWMFLGITDVMQ